MRQDRPELCPLGDTIDWVTSNIGVCTHKVMCFGNDGRNVDWPFPLSGFPYEIIEGAIAAIRANRLRAETAEHERDEARKKAEYFHEQFHGAWNLEHKTHERLKVAERERDEALRVLRQMRSATTEDPGAPYEYD